MRFELPGVEFCKGLVPERRRLAAEAAHAMSVFEKHGINGVEQELMGDQWCTRLVNARRYVERQIELAFIGMCMDLQSKGIRDCSRHSGHREILLPRLPPYRPPYARLRPAVS